MWKPAHSGDGDDDKDYDRGDNSIYPFKIFSNMELTGLSYVSYLI